MQMINITLFGEMLTFVVLIFITMKYIWPPIIKAINERKQKIAEGLQAAERGQNNLELAKKKSTQLLQEARGQADSIIDQASNRSASIIEQGKVKAKTEAQRIYEQAKADLDKDASSIKQQLQQQTATLATTLAEKVLRQDIDMQKNQKIMDQIMEEMQ